MLHLDHGGLCCLVNITFPGTGLETAEDGEWDEDEEVLLEGWEP